MCSNNTLPEKIRQYPGRPKDATKRKGIICAAAALFLEHGYELTSMEAVAKMADVSKLTIYSHFANKSELFKEVIQQGCDQQASPESFMNLVKLPVEQALLQLGNTMAAIIFSADAIRLQRILHFEAVHHPEIIKIFYEAAPQRVKLAFSELLTEWVRQGQLSVQDVQVATEQFFSLLKGEAHVKVMLLLEPKLSPHELEQHVRAGVSLFLAGYQSKTAAGI